MNSEVVDTIARAVLYEGYILYPYRPSVKNRQRWTFGGIYPKAYSDAQGGTDACLMQTQCLIAGSADSTIEASVRFLHLTERIIGQLDKSTKQWPPTGEPPFHRVESLKIDQKQFHSWQEAEERTVALGEFKLADLLNHPHHRIFNFPGSRTSEPLGDSTGLIVGVLIREQQAIQGTVDMSVSQAGESLFRLTVRIENQTILAGATSPSSSSNEPDIALATSRDDALLRSFVSTHARLGVSNGQFVSLTDPLAAYKQAAAACQNIGCWPILVGEQGDTSTMLSSPIILSDYPQIAPESPGDLFDGGEIDEILTLRILTLTDDEKQQMIAVDDRTRDMLARTEALAREQLYAMHGVMRPLEQSHV